MSWQFEWLTSWDEVLSPAFQQRWERFSREAWNSHVFFDPALARAWIDTYRPLRDLQPRFAIASGEGSEVLLPLVLWRRDWKSAWQRLLVPVGHGDYDYHVPLVVGAREGFSWETYWKALLEAAAARWGREYDLLAIDDVRESYVCDGLPFVSREECPFVALTAFPNLEAFWVSMRSKQRTELHRRERRLKALGALEFHVFEPEDLAQAEASLALMLPCHARRWPSAYKAPGFHQNLLRQALPRGLAHFSELRLNGQPISWRLGFIYGKRFYSYMPAFRQEYAASSPGMLHLARCIEYALGRGLETYDYLRGEESYKADWASGAVKTFSLRVPGKATSSPVRNWLSDRVKPQLSTQTFGRWVSRQNGGISRRDSPPVEAAHSGSGWRFEWVTSWNDIKAESFQKQWQRWSDEAFNSHVFFHPALARAWIDTYLPIRDIRPAFLIGRSADATAFFPLVLWKQNWKSAWRRLLVPVGYSDYDYHDPLVVGDASSFVWAAFWDAFLREIETRWSSSFDRLQIEGIRQPCAPQEVAWKQGENCPFRDISAYLTIKDFLSSVSRNLRGDLGRQQRRLAKVGYSHLHVYSGEEIEPARGALSSLLKHHAEHWPKAYKAPGFHERLLREGLTAGVLHFSELQVAERPISWHFHFIWRDRFYAYMVAADKEFSEYSPGKIHWSFCMEAAINMRLQVFDFLRGEESYKSGWANEVVPLRKLMMERKGPSTRLKKWLVTSVKPRLAGRRS